jgi:hypothetical protein
MKKVLIVCGSIVLFAALLMGGCRALIHTIVNSNTCDQFNIDNIELRTGIDIPATTHVDCIYENGVKNVNFTLDTSQVDIRDYLTKNEFVKDTDVYTQQGDKKKTSWSAIYHPNRAVLAMRIVYKDVIVE